MKEVLVLQAVDVVVVAKLPVLAELRIFVLAGSRADPSVVL
jgi:hypothetical protein